MEVNVVEEDTVVEGGGQSDTEDNLSVGARNSQSPQIYLDVLSGTKGGR